MEINILEERLDPEIQKKHAKYSHAVKEFINSDNNKGTLQFKCNSLEEAKTCYNTLKHYDAYHNLGVCVWRKNCDVYVVIA